MSSSQTRKRSSRLESQQEAIVDSAKRQLQEVGTTAQDAVTSGVWAYPVLVRSAREILQVSARVSRSKYSDPLIFR